MSLEGLTEIDKQILDIIKDNARLGYTEIAEKVGISRVSVKKKMDEMEKNGIIKGYKTVVDETSIPSGIHFILDLETEPDWYETIVERLSYDKRIRKIYGTTGACKIHCTGFASNQNDVDYFTRSLYRNAKGIRRLWWDVLTSTFKDVDGGIEYERIKYEESEDNRGNESVDERADTGGTQNPN